jgi:hypothetical protein
MTSDALFVVFLIAEWLLARLTRVEVDLRSERDRTQEFLDLTGAMVVVLDARGDITLVNRRARRPGRPLLAYASMPSAPRRPEMACQGVKRT